MTTVPGSDRAVASEIGGRALEAFTNAPRLNRWIFSKLAPHIHGDVLEIGGGIGNLSRLIVERASTVVVSDVEPRYLDALRRTFCGDPRVTVARFDLDGEPEPSVGERRYDTIVAVNVIEHIRDDVGLVGRLATMLKPGGNIAVYVPACPLAYGALDRTFGHHRRYTPQTLSSLLSGAGLEVVPPRYMNLLGLIGWIVSGRILRRDRLSSRQIALFERLMPLIRVEDHLRLPFGLGLYATARRFG